MSIVITAKQDKFRRCGIVHSAHATEYPSDKFTAAELKILKAEPMLMVREVPDEESEVRGQKSEVSKDEKTDVRGQKSEVSKGKKS